MGVRARVELQTSVEGIAEGKRRDWGIFGVVLLGFWREESKEVAAAWRGR